MRCKCGCGQEVGRYARQGFVRGHHLRVNNPAKRPEVRKRISEGRRRVLLSKEAREKIRIGVLRHYKKHPETIERIRQSVIRFHRKYPNRTGTGTWSREQREVYTKKMAKTKKVLYKAGTLVSPFTRPDVRKKAIETMRRRYGIKSNIMESTEIREKAVGRLLKAIQAKPNKAEVKLLSILEKLSPNDWDYTGDGSLIIEGKIPDFVHKNQPRIIELFGKYWHSPKDVEERKSFFAKHGYETLVIWDDELTEDEVAFKMSTIGWGTSN